MPTEVEAKFRAEGPGPLEALAVAERLGNAILGPARTVDETDRYLDTDDRRLASARWACRLRLRDGTTRISLKGPPSDAPAAAWHHRRPEVEGPATDEIAPNAWPASEARDLLESLAGGRALIEHLRVRQARTERTVTLDGGEPIGTLTLDRVRLAAGDADLGELFVVELELDPASTTGESELSGLADALASVPGLVPEPRTKLEHALHRLQRARMTHSLPRPRTLAEWLAVGAALAVFAHLGWDSALWDARLQLLLHLVAVGAILGLVSVAVRRGELPRTPVDLPLLGLLAAYALATASALNVGMSLRAMAAITALALMLPVALLAVRHRPAWVGLVTSVPVLLLSIPTLVALLARRLEWILVGAPGLPPLRLPAEGTPFGSVAVPPFVIIPAWALAGLIQPAWLRRIVRIGLVAVGIPMTILSGSRSAWLAIGVAAVIGAAPFAWRYRQRLRPSRVTWRALLAVAAGLAVVALVVALVIPRLTAITSVLYRFALWRDTLAAWQTDPILGIGPGFMPYARQAAAADFTFPVRQPHSHNLPLGVLGDAGVVGLALAAVVVVTLLVVAGPWRSRTSVGRTAGIVLIGLGVGGLFDDLTFIPGFDLLAITLIAVALLDAGSVDWARPSWGRRSQWLPATLAAGAGGAVLLAAMVTADAGGIAYRAGIRSAVDRSWAESTSWLTRAVEIDPWHPAGPAALVVAAEAAGRPEVARSAAETATTLNPGDATAWANLSLLCRAAGDEECQVHAANRAAAMARYGPAELLNAAVLLEDAGEAEAADRAYRLSLLSQVRTSFVLDWPRTVHVGDGTIPDYSDAAWQLNRLLALYEMGEPIAPEEFTDPGVRALAHAMAGDRLAAEAQLAAAIESTPDTPATWDFAIVLRDAWGQPVDDELRVAEVVRGRPFPPSDLDAGVASQSFDVSSFRAYPRDGFVTDAVRTFTSPPYPWILAELLP